jgi:hypothetical protein
MQSDEGARTRELARHEAERLFSPEVVAARLAAVLEAAAV